jgi:hypothetical protein
MSPAMQSWREQMKFALDPQGVFAAQLPLDEHDETHSESAAQVAT